jgi:hypothetical protein
LEALPQVVPRIEPAPDDVARILEVGFGRMLKQPHVRVGEVADIDQLKAGCGARQCLTDAARQPAVGCAQVGIVRPDDTGRIGDLQRHTAALVFTGDDLALALGPRIRLTDVGEGSGFVDTWRPRMEEHHDAGDVEEISDADLASGAEHRVRPADVGVIHLSRPARIQ